MTIHSRRFCENFIRRNTVGFSYTILSKFIVFGWFIYSNIGRNRWCIPPRIIVCDIFSKCLFWYSDHCCCHDACEWDGPLYEPPGKWHHEYTECKLGEHSFVAKILSSEYRRKCYEYEEYGIDKIGDIGYRHPEWVHDRPESEEVTTRPVRRHEPSCHHDSRRDDDSDNSEYYIESFDQCVVHVFYCLGLVFSRFRHVSVTLSCSISKRQTLSISTWNIKCNWRTRVSITHKKSSESNQSEKGSCENFLEHSMSYMSIRTQYEFFCKLSELLSFTTLVFCFTFDELEFLEDISTCNWNDDCRSLDEGFTVVSNCREDFFVLGLESYIGFSEFI